MRLTRIPFYCAVALAASVVTSIAADMPIKAPPNYTDSTAVHQWTGFYIGGQAGYGFGHSKVNAMGGPTLATFDERGGVFGARFGFNWQIGEFGVVGIVADGDYLGGVKDTAVGVTAKYSWMASVRGRAGLLLNPKLLVYGTAGLAFANSGLFTGPVAAENIRAGFVVGGGAEYRFNQHWSTFLEGTWTDFNRDNKLIVLTQSSDIWKIMGGVNYKF